MKANIKARVDEEDSEDLEIQGTIVINVYKDPTIPLKATVTGEVLHRHILASNACVTKAFRTYMINKRRPESTGDCDE